MTRPTPATETYVVNLHSLTAAPPGWRVWHAADEGEEAPVWWEPLIGWPVDPIGDVTPVTADGSGMVDDARGYVGFLALTGPGLPAHLIEGMVAENLASWQRNADRPVDTSGVAAVVAEALAAAR